MRASLDATICALVLCVTAALTGCSVSPSTAKESATPTPQQVGSIGRPGCTPSAAINSGQAEAGFDAPTGSLWMLVFGSIPPIAGQDSKIVWRMTGSGDFRIWAEDGDGVRLDPKWGPEGHGSSSWNHPGTEVGTGFVFPHSGCWHIRLARQNTSGDAWLTVT
jgi:hypothetical protein